MNNLPGSPWKRSGIIARAGVKTGGNYIRHHVGNALPIKSLHQDKETLNRKNALSLIKELSQLRGAALKMAQGLSMDTGVLPEEFSEVMNAAQYRVPAMNRSLVRTQFKSTVGSEPEEFFKRFEYEAFAAATIGQVHRAEDKQGRALAVKIQYPNVQKSIESDLSLLKTIAASFLRKFDLNEHLDEMKLRLIEETDYMREGENLVRFSKTFHSPWIIFPKYLKKYSNSKVIALDRDIEIIKLAEKLEKKYLKRFVFKNIKFSELHKVKELKEIDYFIFDLGVSHFQLKDMKRGFSFRSDDSQIVTKITLFCVT